jgi:hypothetical protein
MATGDWEMAGFAGMTVIAESKIGALFLVIPINEASSVNPVCAVRCGNNTDVSIYCVNRLDVWTGFGTHYVIDNEEANNGGKCIVEVLHSYLGHFAINTQAI